MLWTIIVHDPAMPALSLLILNYLPKIKARLAIRVANFLIFTTHKVFYVVTSCCVLIID